MSGLPFVAGVAAYAYLITHLHPLEGTLVLALSLLMEIFHAFTRKVGDRYG